MWGGSTLSLVGHCLKHGSMALMKLYTRNLGVFKVIQSLFKHFIERCDHDAWTRYSVVPPGLGSTGHGSTLSSTFRHLFRQ